ncbi:hypothetical protein TSAR_000942 [Trichomalopsis sarcophagae]|uniref:Uncharacterized protein n=1 Tax=Trichomalopsis sarcophagae TaxID=543379 RepID=A0A232F1M8_9HYME|nr:hypothetical protein TSAR_000942 [Trichomalopsis sarcophagae]
MAATYTRVSQYLSFIDTVINGEMSGEVRFIPVHVKG